MPKSQFFLASTCATLILSLAAVSNIAHAEDESRHIAVSGKSERRVAPDMAHLQLDVVTENADAASARREADAITGRALAVLREAGLADADIDSTGLSISPQFRWLKDERKQELTGYRVSRSIEVRLLNLEALGELVTTLTDTGINRMQAPRLGLQDEEALYQELLAAAAENARERADVIAAALGETRGPVISINTERVSTPRPMRAERMMMAADAAAPAPSESYSAGHLSYSVNVNAAFSLN
ncbi:SIMPL domain-containing protein [Congregibacter brevis]|uniref:SIMPL domain-containing protein n=1 Tax=Congregibacter brevis TaxID=3081201 RepID=A0ABZ0I9W9_9GAMM|nr:SIMPL domain-containing protein [Congregibacter sp. IMCC45268]